MPVRARNPSARVRETDAFLRESIFSSPTCSAGKTSPAGPSCLPDCLWSVPSLILSLLHGQSLHPFIWELIGFRPEASSERRCPPRDRCSRGPGARPAPTPAALPPHLLLAAPALFRFPTHGRHLHLSIRIRPGSPGSARVSRFSEPGSVRPGARAVWTGRPTPAPGSEAQGWGPLLSQGPGSQGNRTAATVRSRRCVRPSRLQSLDLGERGGRRAGARQHGELVPRRSERGVDTALPAPPSPWRPLLTQRALGVLRPRNPGPEAQGLTGARGSGP